MSNVVLVRIFQTIVEVMPNNIIPDEIARYDALAATWWQADGPMWPLQELNGLRAPYVNDQLCRHLAIESAQAKLLTGITVLDIGCGAGLLSEALAERGASVVGIDPAKRNIAIARTHAAIRS